MQIIYQDILKVTRGIIAHQCNCQGVMGAGLAKAIRSLWPAVYNSYWHDYEHHGLKLGTVSVIHVGPELAVANLMAQEYYGRKPGVVYTDYKALRSCLWALRQYREYNPNVDPTWPIYIPYKMGCGLAGGDWDTVSKIINEELPCASVCLKSGKI